MRTSCARWYVEKSLARRAHRVSVERVNQGRTLERALDVIECVEASRTPMKLTQISKETGLHITTTQRITTTLARRGYLSSTEAGYTLGPVVLAHAHAFMLQDRLAAVSHPVLQNLAETTGFTASVYVRSGWSRILVARVEPPESLRYRFPIGQRLDLDVGGGKVLLAAVSPEELDEFLAEYTGIALADGRQQTADSLRAELAEIATTGTYESHSERYPGTASLTATIADSRGRAIGAVNLVTTTETIDGDGLARFRSRVIQAARVIGEQL